MDSKPEPKKRGGKRENAGRRTLNETTRAKRISLTLDDKTLDKAALIGTGNISEGVRIAVNKVLPD
jgi:hypothetical protein